MLTLYVVPPAFGLPSIDPQCLAAVTYLKHALSSEEWQVVADVHAVGNGGAGDWRYLPALWVGDRQIHGFLAIVEYIQRRTDTAADASSSDQDWILTNHVQSHLSPLISLLFYTSPENYASTTRPAFSKSLPFPSSWILPVNQRRQEMESADAAQLDVTANQLSALASSLTDVAKKPAVDPLGSQAYPLTDNDILSLHPVDKAPRENSTSAVIDTHKKLRALVAESLSIHAMRYEGADGGSASHGPYSCALFAHLGLAVAAARTGMPHPWLTSALQRQYQRLAEGALKWLSDEWHWRPSASRGDGAATVIGQGLPWIEERISTSERTSAFSASMLQVSGIGHLQVPTRLYSRTAEGLDDGQIIFAARKAPGRALGHEYDPYWLSATGLTMALLAFKAWQEGF